MAGKSKGVECLNDTERLDRFIAMTLESRLLIAKLDRDEKENEDRMAITLRAVREISSIDKRLKRRGRCSEVKKATIEKRRRKIVELLKPLPDGLGFERKDVYKHLKEHHEDLAHCKEKYMWRDFDEWQRSCEIAISHNRP